MLNRRLLIITKHFLEPRDAQAQQSAALIAALSAAGAKIDVITGAVEGNDGIASHASLTIHALPTRWLTQQQSLAAKVTRKLERNVSAWLPTRWARAAARLASQLMAGERYDAFISIALPMESHIAALHARRQAPWIACLSDPWPESILPAPYSDFAIPLLNALQKRVVSRSFTDADALVFPCAEERDYLARHYPSLAKGKSFLIPHVAPASLAPGSDAARGNDTLTLIHGGALSRERVCPGLAEAMAALPSSSRLQLRFVGQVHPDMLAAFERAGAMHRVSFDGWKSKQDALRILSSASALLLVEASMADYPFLPSKLADYSATGRPILAITGERSPATRMIGEHQAGFLATHDKQSILDALLAMEAQHARFSSQGLHGLFQASRIAAVYADIIDSLRTRTISSAAAPSP